MKEFADFWPHFAYAPLEFEPGTQGLYSNSNFLVLGAIIDQGSVAGIRISDTHQTGVSAGAPPEIVPVAPPAPARERAAPFPAASGGGSATDALGEPSNSAQRQAGDTADALDERRHGRSAASSPRPP